MAILRSGQPLHLASLTAPQLNGREIKNAMAGGPLDFGERLGEYRLLNEVGRGAMGVVFRAAAPDGTTVAIKVLVPPPLLQDQERESVRRRFLREARALASIHHPGVVRVFDYGESDGNLYLAMEFLDGRNLREVLSEGGPFPPERVRELGLQLLSALDAVHHAGIVHRDVKPENLVLLPDGGLKLADFGVAWVETEATLTRTGGVLGSPAYMAPEQILGQGVDRRSDLFSAAATLYQLLADRLPFPGGTLIEMAHRVAYAEPEPLPSGTPHALGRVLFKALQKTPAARYATATEFEIALREAGSVTSARPTPVGTATLHAPAPGEATVLVPGPVSARCPRHPSRVAIASCKACGKPLCPHCAKGSRAPYYCFLHRPVTVLGIPVVRLEVAVAALAFFLLLLCLSPLGYAALSR